MLDSFFRFIFKITGWKLSGRFPYHIKKTILIVAPHAKTIDFPVGLGARAAIGVKMNFLAKQELFKGFFGWLFYWLGGYPVDRSKNNQVVKAVNTLYKSKEELHIVIAPEGTRKEVDKLKMGFYFIAKTTEIPIVMIGFDYSTKQIVISEPFYTTDDSHADLKQIALFFNSIGGDKKAWVANYLKY